GLVGEQLQRVVLNAKGLPIRRDSLLVELKQRIREVRQGPDGLLYLLTDEDAGALLRIEAGPGRDSRRTLGYSPPRRGGVARQLVIRAATLIDGKGGVTRNVSIVVQGSRIARIDASAQGTTYDLKGLTVMPGWIDTHVHMDAHFDPNGKSHSPASAKNETPQQTMLYAVENAYNVLMAGFTTAQSVGAP